MPVLIEIPCFKTETFQKKKKKKTIQDTKTPLANKMLISYLVFLWRKLLKYIFLDNYDISKILDEIVTALFDTMPVLHS